LLDSLLQEVGLYYGLVLIKLSQYQQSSLVIAEHETISR